MNKEINQDQLQKQFLFNQHLENKQQINQQPQEKKAESNKQNHKKLYQVQSKQSEKICLLQQIATINNKIIIQDNNLKEIQNQNRQNLQTSSITQNQQKSIPNIKLENIESNSKNIQLKSKKKKHRQQSQELKRSAQKYLYPQNLDQKKKYGSYLKFQINQKTKKIQPVRAAYRLSKKKQKLELDKKIKQQSNNKKSKSKNKKLENQQQVQQSNKQTKHFKQIKAHKDNQFFQKQQEFQSLKRICKEFEYDQKDFQDNFDLFQERDILIKQILTNKNYEYSQFMNNYTSKENYEQMQESIQKQPQIIKPKNQQVQEDIPIQIKRIINSNLNNNNNYALVQVQKSTAFYLKTEYCIVPLTNICRADKTKVIQDLNTAKKLIKYKTLGYIQCDKKIQKLLKKHDKTLNDNNPNFQLNIQIIDPNINNQNIYALILRTNGQDINQYSLVPLMDINLMKDQQKLKQCVRRAKNTIKNMPLSIVKLNSKIQKLIRDYQDKFEKLKFNQKQIIKMSVLNPNINNNKNFALIRITRIINGNITIQYGLIQLQNKKKSSIQQISKDIQTAQKVAGTIFLIHLPLNQKIEKMLLAYKSTKMEQWNEQLQQQVDERSKANSVI